ncbi:MAG: thioredoxin family protein [Candidatus Krumholzibacteriia bacterium]
MKKIHIPIVGGGPSPAPPPYGGLGEQRWLHGETFLEVVEAAGRARAQLDGAFAAVDVSAELRDFFVSYPRKVSVLVLGDLERVDTLVNVAQAERLFSLGKNIWMRVFPARDNPDLVEVFAGPEGELPLFVFFGDDRREFARWGPRPRALQDVEEESRPHTEDAGLEARRRTWYAANRGRDLAAELEALLSPRLGGY